jgi:hypothetical protein
MPLLMQKQIDETRASLLQWSKITPVSPTAVFQWQPPMPLILTGIVFSDPVVVDSVYLSYDLLIAPPEEGQRRVAVPALYFSPRIFLVTDYLRVILSEPVQTTATLEFSEEAFVRWMLEGDRRE